MTSKSRVFTSISGCFSLKVSMKIFPSPKKKRNHEKRSAFKFCDRNQSHDSKLLYKTNPPFDLEPSPRGEHVTKRM